MATESFTCVECEQLVSVELTEGEFLEYFGKQDSSSLTPKELHLHNVLRQVHVNCQSEHMVKARENFGVGTFSSYSFFDTDEHREVFFLNYVVDAYTVDGVDMCEVWQFNGSSRNVRKGGQAFMKDKLSTELAMGEMLSRNHTNKITTTGIETFFRNHFKNKRQRLLAQMVIDETSFMVDSFTPFETAELQHNIDGYKSLIEDSAKAQSALWNTRPAR